jgi:methylmalonyl-CoA/ethylmalonyl-CoA epimerase
VTIPALSFHHFGIACRDLDREEAAYAELGYKVEAPDFVDPVQGVRGRFLAEGGPRLELLVALEGSQVLEPWLTTGTSRVYHEAFETPDLKIALDSMAGSGARFVVEPAPAVAFNGREICFVMLRNMALVELIQAGRL